MQHHRRLKSYGKMSEELKYNTQPPHSHHQISLSEAEVLALKHESRIFGQWSNPVSGSRKSQASSPWAKQHRDLTYYIMEKPHTGLDECPTILLLCFRARISALKNIDLWSGLRLHRWEKCHKIFYFLGSPTSIGVAIFLRQFCHFVLHSIESALIWESRSCTNEA